MTMADLTGAPVSMEAAIAVLDSLGDGAFTLDGEDVFTWIDDRGLAGLDLGYDRESLLGEHVSLITSVGDAHRIRSLAHSVMASGQSTSRRCDLTLEARDGREVPVALHVAPIVEGDEIAGTLVVARDLTQQRQRTERLMVLTRLLRHDLRSKTNVIGGRLELIEDDLSPGATDHLEATYDALRDLTALSDKTLELNRAVVDAGGHRSAVDAVDMVRTVVDEARDTYPAADIELTGPGSAPVRADGTLALALENVVGNAVEHSDRDRPQVAVTVESDGSDASGPVTITVADDGPGIPESDLAAVTRGREDPLNHGSGLGLWLVKWVVESFGGAVAFEERDPRGTVVRIELQAAD